MCMLLCLSNCFPPKLTLCLCVKDDSPASTRSSSPKLDWMIKRGMVGPKCVLVWHWFTFSTPLPSLGFVMRLRFIFCCGLDCFCLHHFLVLVFRRFWDKTVWFACFYDVVKTIRKQKSMTMFGLHCPDMLHHCHTFPTCDCSFVFLMVW